MVGVSSLAAALLLRHVRPAEGLLPRLWYGDAQSASSVLQAMVTAVVTATTMTFSVTVVTLQLASQQFSPRLLRQFPRDPVTKVVLTILTATFVFASTVLAGLRADQPLPDLALLIAHILGLASFAAVIAFIAHIVRIVRVDSMMRAVHDETNRAITTFYEPYGSRSGSPQTLDLPAEQTRMVTSADSGFLVSTDVDALVRCAQQYDARIRIGVRPGDHVVRGTPVASVWRAASDEERDEDAHEGLRDAVVGALHLGYERTLDQDAAFGMRQLEDIAVKAMSPGINDPVTAATAVGHMASVLATLVGCRLGPTLHDDSEGVARVLAPGRDLRYYLDLASGQLRRFGSEEPTVLMALLRMLRDVAVAARDEDQRAEVRRAATLVCEELDPSVRDTDATAIRDLNERVELALRGDLQPAFADRSGETRSL